jgi:hypothetical protein
MAVVEAGGAGAGIAAVGGAQGREAGQAGGERGGAAAGLFGEDDLVEEADGGVRGRAALALVNEFVEG